MGREAWQAAVHGVTESDKTATEHTRVLFTSDVRVLSVWNAARWKRLEAEWMVQMWSWPLEGCLPVKAEKTGQRGQ